jgi:hypothetical protein
MMIGEMVEFPRDSRGMPIHVGDVLAFGDEMVEVDSLTLFRDGEWVILDDDGKILSDNLSGGTVIGNPQALAEENATMRQLLEGLEHCGYGSGCSCHVVSEGETIGVCPLYINGRKTCFELKKKLGIRGIDKTWLTNQ